MVTNLPTICLSIVSHLQGDLTLTLLCSIEKYCRDSRLSVIVTLNIEEEFRFKDLTFPYPLRVIKNNSPKGFGANHNAAFSSLELCDFFCVLNPDIIFTSNPFPHLLSALEDPAIGVVAPSLTDSDLLRQDSAREFPTPIKILHRIRRKEKLSDFQRDKKLFYPDWVAGMFMLFPASVFAKVNGFDEQYYMYCEDADICMRLRQIHFKTVYVPSIFSIHDARRSSHMNRQHLWWHICSLLRFFIQYGFIRNRREKQLDGDEATKS